MRSVPILVRSVTAAPEAVVWSPDARRVLEHAGGPLRVLGGPGTGKTTLVAHTVADRVLQGVDPEQVLVLTSSRRAAAELRERIVEQLASHGVTPTVREPLVRTVHSYAFALLRLQAALRDLPPPRLLSGPDQDVVIRDLLAGERAAGATGWPARLRPALGLPAFAAELRDLLMRAAERGLAPEDLSALGRKNGRDEWVAAGRFFRTYEQVMLLRGSVGTAAPQATAPALDAAELVSAALLVLDTDAEVTRRESDRVRHLIVDDAQHLDPLQAALVTRLGASAHELLLVGDPDQTVFSFRGADPGLLTTGSSAVIRLCTDHRMAAAVRAAVSRLASRLPGPRATLYGPEGEQPGGDVTVRVFGSAATEASWVANQLRRAHLLDGVAWSDMAVLVRSTARALPVLRRGLLAAGVPVAAPREELPVARQGAVLPILAVLRCAVQPAALDEETAAALLTSPLGGADPLALRRLRRELRRRELIAHGPQSSGPRSSGALLVEVLRADHESDICSLDGLEDRTVAPARRLASLLTVVARAARRGDSAEQVLWQLWQASGLAQRWAATAARGGTAGVQADRGLDAMVALFDAAGRYADRLPGADGGPAGVLGFCDYLTDQQIPGDSLAARSPQGESVTVLTVHAAAGREWSLVAVPGVQEGSWPDLRLRGSLLGVEHLVDTTAGIDSPMVSRTAPLLAEERRLLLVAASRARHRLLVSAVRGEDEQPSRFLDELEGTDESTNERSVAPRERGLVLAELVAELRRVCCDPAEDSMRRRSAAAGLAQLAQVRVSAAHPDSWYGLGPPSGDAPLRVPGEPARVSPSLVELVSSCPLRWLLTRHGGEDIRALPAVTGSLVHRLVQAAAAGATDQQLEQALGQAWTGVDAGAPWYSRAEQQRVRRMVAMFRTWWHDSRGELTEVGCEQKFEVSLPPADRATHGPLEGTVDDTAVQLQGRVDRLERDRHGRPVIVDVKSSKTPISKEAAEDHAQLALYQLAAAHGAFAEHGLTAEPGGACIVQVAARTAASVQRNQQPLDAPTLARWHDVVREAARRTAGPEFLAIDNGDCTRCPSKIACPLHDSGRQVPG
jgi:superfamily I DNA/RNA helicase/RecB family exonuclease